MDTTNETSVAVDGAHEDSIAPAEGARPPRRFGWDRRRVIFWFVSCVVLGVALKWGIDHRRWAFEYHTPLRFYSDIERGFYWGNRCLSGGFLEPYELMADQPSEPWGMLWL